MNCNETKELFSPFFDGELGADLRQEFDAHRAACEECGRGYQEFERATHALQHLEVRDVERAYVDELAAVAWEADPEAEAAAALVPPPRSRLAPMMSHAAALLSGAALVLLFLRPSTADLPRVEPKAVAAPVVQPVVEVVEHIRERVHTVEVPVLVPLPPKVREVDSGVGLALFAEALHAFGGALGQSTELLAALQAAPEPEVEREEPVPDSLPEAPPTPATEVGPRPTPRVTRAYPSPTPRRAAAVVVERRGSVLSLQTNGTLDEIVPALISRLGDDDPMVVEAARGQLRDIHARRDGEGAASPEDRDPDPAVRHIGWRRWTERESETPSASEKWSTWWERERQLLASAPD